MNRFTVSKPAVTLCLSIVLTLVGLVNAKAQGIGDVDRERALVMLDEIKGSLKRSYYDPTFRGIDIDSRFKSAEEMVKKATSLGQAFGIIAQTLMALDDSHTFFIPPEQTVSVDYGWEMSAVGEQCFISAVKPGTDAEIKGVKPGDQVLSVNGVAPTRRELWKINYLFKVIRPQPGMRLVLQSPDGQRRQVDVLSKVTQTKRKLNLESDDIWILVRDIERDYMANRNRYQEFGQDLLIWKLPEFYMRDEFVDKAFDRARKHKALVLDLRGNSGGAESTLLRMVGNLFDHDIRVGSLKTRKESKDLIAKSRGNDIFTGKLIILTDSESGSASEILARLVQLEKRGTVIGDRSAGAVMRGRHVDYQMGRDTAVFYGASITDADILMTDGRSLEGTGASPDEVMLPTGADLANNRDPVLARAAALAGVELDAAKAGTLFPRIWPKP